MSSFSACTRTGQVKTDARRFGLGVLPSMPTYRAPWTAEDEQWWAEEGRREEDREIDRRYGEWLATERLEAGLWA